VAALAGETPVAVATAAKTVFGVDQVGWRQPTLMAKRLLPVKTHASQFPAGGGLSGGADGLVHSIERRKGGISWADPD
jgi:hypothetical protein